MSELEIKNKALDALSETNLDDMNLDDSFDSLETEQKTPSSGTIGDGTDARNPDGKPTNAPNRDEHYPIPDHIYAEDNETRSISMILVSKGRAFSQALMSIAGTRQRSGRLWLACIVTFIVIALLLIQVSYRHRELNLGYALSDAISQRERLLEENRRLRIELRVHSQRERLEPLAGKQLGMTTVRPDQVIIVNVPAESSGTLPPSGKRLDGLDNVKRIGEK